MTEAPSGRDADAELLAAIRGIRRHWRVRRVIEGLPAVVAAALAGLLIGLAFRAALADATAIVAATRAVGYLLLAAAVVVF
ncbi:MAG: hypothetical protein ACREL5_05120, partial [Gemmatimonadales bacterium]